MADIREIIQNIMQDPKIVTSRNFSDRVYVDQPILIPAPQLERFTPPRIREMRNLGKNGGFDAKVFYEQGRFMEDYEDDCEYRGEFVQYFPTYKLMTDAQLRGYFTWRTRVRRGDVTRTSLSFAFVYIYELLNQIGVRSPEEGFHVLKNFWTTYREIERRVDMYMPLWLKDYVVYNNLDKSLLEGLSDAGFDEAVSALLDFRARGRDAVFSALNSLSSYDLEKSKFFKLHPDDMKDVVYRVFSVVSDYYNRNPKNSARDKLFGRMCANSYLMFKSAVFYHRTRQENRTYEIGDWHRYRCENGNWSCERFVWYGHNNKRIGAILKTVDYLMRSSHGYKSTLQPGKTNKILTAKIEKEIAKYEREKIENAPPKIDIDVSKLHSIRTAAQATQSRLLVDEPEAEPAIATPVPAAVSPVSEHGLDDTERAVLCCLLYGGNSADAARSKGTMLSVVIDGINEKLFDAFGDTVIVDEGNEPEVLEDYREELKGMIPR